MSVEDYLNMLGMYNMPNFDPSTVRKLDEEFERV